MSSRRKLRRLIPSLPSLLCNMVKKRSAVTTHKLPVSSDSDDDAGGRPAATRTETHRHVVYASTQETFSRRTSYLSVPASPKKRARVSPDDSGQCSTPADTGSDAPQDSLDLEYLYHRIETLALDGNVRKRTEGVGVLLGHFNTCSDAFL